MELKRYRSLFWGLSAILALVAAPVAAQEGRQTTVAYERETFEYQPSGRPDPFHSLLRDGELGIRIEDLVLRGVVHHSDPAQSVAFLMVQGSERRIQARLGERFGTLRVAAIHPDRVDVVAEELGIARRETLRMQSPRPRTTEGS